MSGRLRARISDVDVRLVEEVADFPDSAYLVNEPVEALQSFVGSQ